MLPGKAFTPEDIVRIAYKRIWYILVPAAVFGAVTAIASQYLPDRYRSDTLILVVPQQVPESYVRPTVTTRIEDRLQSISQQILSRTRLERIIQDLNLYATDRADGAIMEDVVERMRRDIDVQIVKGDAFRVAYVAEEPRTAMRVTERLASLFIEENLRDREVLAEGTNQFLESQLDEARRRLVTHEQKLEEFRRANAGQLPSQVQSNLQVVQNTQMQIQSVLEALDRDRERKLALERAIADAGLPDGSRDATSSLPAVADANGVAGNTTSQKLEAARAFLRQLQTRLKPEHPDVVRTQRIIADLEKKLESEELAQPISPEGAQATRDPVNQAKANRLKELQAQLEDVNGQITAKQQEEQRLRAVVASYQARVEAAPTRETQLTELMRDYTTLQSVYTNLLQKREESKVAANLERRQIGEQFKLLDPARVPQRPFSPNRIRINIMGLAAGFALGFALVALLEYRDATFKADDDVVLLLAVPVLATVPLMQTRREKRVALRWRLIRVATLSTVVLAGAAVLVWSFLANSRVGS